MRTYENKEELKNEINKSFAKYISEFDDIPEYLKDMRVDEVDRTPAENLAYQVGWTTLVIKWESDERKGLHVKTPSDNFRWNQLGGLYQWFTDTYAHLSLQELKAMLNENINMIYEMIDSLSDEELFEPHMRKWADEATKTAVWEVYKFIHVNTVAPFGTFRTKIRKWKKIALQLGIEISCIPRNLIIVIFYYQISLKPLKTLSLSQVSFPLLFPLYYIVPPVFTNSDKGKYKGKKIL